MHHCFCCSDAPKILYTVPESGELEVNLGKEVDMSCVAAGFPEPVISWRMKVRVVSSYYTTNQMTNYQL